MHSQWITGPSCSAQKPKGSRQTRSPAQAQSGSSLQPAGIGSQVAWLGPKAMFSTQSLFSGQNVQSGTTSQNSAGTHLPVQQAGVVVGSWPSGQTGGSASQATLI